MTASTSDRMLVKAALVNPPFASIHTPSIQLGLIKALCARDNIAVDDIYSNIELAATLGVRRYQAVCFSPSPDLGEWLFGHAAFGNALPPAPYLQSFRAELEQFSMRAEISIDELVDLRQNRIPAWVDEQAEQLARYPLVAFTSTFQQNVAGLALAKSIKRINADTVTCMGGANYHGTMGREYFRALPFIDYVATGEADHIVADLFKAILSGDGMASRVGLLSRRDGGAGAKEHDAIYLGAMDALPMPDYEQFFATLARLGVTQEELGFPIALPFESSRGCWWGAKHHCTFCGLNSVGMAFRSKSPQRVGAEVASIVEKYGISRLDATDNIIERKKMAELMEAYRSIPANIDFFYEIKANVSADDVREMRRCGIKRVQPGIESFSSDVLKIMNKGTTGLNNINALRWFSTFGVDPLWNILYGFPAETSGHYNDQAKLVPLILHLPPPQVMTRINIDRFSPNFELPELRDLFEKIVPFASYTYLYPSYIEIEKIAYHFVGIPKEAPDEADYLPFFRGIKQWKRMWKQDELTPFTDWPSDRPMLTYTEQTDNTAIIFDTRVRIDQPQRILISGVKLELMRAFLYRPTSIKQTERELLASGFSAGEIADNLEDLFDLRLLVREGDVALALPVVSNWPLDEPVAKRVNERLDYPSQLQPA